MEVPVVAFRVPGVVDAVDSGATGELDPLSVSRLPPQSVSTFGSRRCAENTRAPEGAESANSSPVKRSRPH